MPPVKFFYALADYLHGDIMQHSLPRKACDRCHIKKLRCNTTEGDCERCLKARIACVRSPSLRRRKAPRSRKQCLRTVEEGRSSQDQLNLLDNEVANTKENGSCGFEGFGDVLSSNQGPESLNPPEGIPEHHFILQQASQLEESSTMASSTNLLPGSLGNPQLASFQSPTGAMPCGDSSFYAEAVSTRYSSHRSSAAQSPNPNTDEDWTRISDLVGRRRIQNRIAQRNNRKKFKLRLGVLDHGASSSLESSEQTLAEKVPSQETASTNAKNRRASNPDINQPQLFANYSTPSFFAAQYSQFPMSTIPSIAYLNAPASNSHTLHAQYPYIPQAPYPDFSPPNPDAYLPPPPLPQPNYGSYGASTYAVDNREDETLNNFNISYSPIEGMDALEEGTMGLTVIYDPAFNGDHGD